MIIIVSGNDPVQLYQEIDRQKKRLGVKQPIKIGSDSDDLFGAIEKLFTIPMFGGPQLVIIEGEIETETLKKLVDKVRGLPPTSHLIISHPALMGTNDKILKIFSPLEFQHVSTKRRESDAIFAFLDCLVQGDLTNTIRTLTILEQDRVEPQYILSMCIWQFRQILYGHLSTNSFRRSHPFVQQKIRSVLPKYSLSQIYEILNFLLDCDNDLKNGKLMKESLTLYLVTSIHEYQVLSQTNQAG